MHLLSLVGKKEHVEMPAVHKTLFFFCLPNSCQVSHRLSMCCYELLANSYSVQEKNSSPINCMFTSDPLLPCSDNVLFPKDPDYWN